ncbi:MAG: hypothetical protein HLUCCX10_12655 [Algoriphagus marincola HL-49]|uniref:Uncharacterized protein n=1 Tax=Algoriphagus marincola HL-49 TaxID=1305737 RepID=A0A0N8KFA1_9BACT|nr:MAG: hypothetical protein HLUCCX10_12655 [Algoriphagus marincola HL-49]
MGLEGLFEGDKTKKEVVSDLFFKLAPPLGLPDIMRFASSSGQASRPSLG